MPVAEPIIKAESDRIRSYWLSPQSAGGTPRLQWTGYKLSNESAFFKPLWETAKKQGGRICFTSNNNLNKLDYAGWFNYFYNEAKPFAIQNDQIGEVMGRILSLLFDLKISGTGSGAKVVFEDDFPLSLGRGFYGLLERSPRAIPKAILSYLFQVGFEEASTTTAGDYFSKNLALKSNMTDGVALRSTKGTFVFCYRGDTRDLASVIKQGARCRAELDFWRKDAGVEKPWHPWNDVDEKWQKMWFRKGSADNDYFTMNSLAKEFHISCAYPMFRSFEIDQRLKGPVSGWNDELRKLLPKTVTIRTIYDKKSASWQEVLSDESRVFACAIPSDTVAARTFDLNNYPESAVRNVNLEDMLAWIKVRRYHHPPDGPSSHYDSTRIDPSMTIEVLSWGWVRAENETRASLGCTENGFKPVAAKLQNLCGKVFDISHTSFYPNASYDVKRRKPPTVGPDKPKHGQVERVKIGW